MIYFVTDTDLYQLFPPRITKPFLYYTDLEYSCTGGKLHTHAYTHPSNFISWRNLQFFYILSNSHSYNSLNKK